ncbi:hypothetical protein ABG067_004224 [Albugo candida]
METHPSNEDTNEGHKTFRKRFAIYGRQNDHISHISSNSVDRLDSSDHHSDTDSNHVQHTLMLQENGKLAHFFNEVDYLVEGLLSPSKFRSIPAIEHAQTVLELIRMLRDVKVQKLFAFSDGLEKSSRECKIGYRLRTVVNLLSNSDISVHHPLQVCLAALAYQMSSCTTFSEMVDDEMVKLMMKQIRQTCPKREMFEGHKKGLVMVENVTNKSVQSGGSAKKKRCFLKRKSMCNDGKNEEVIFQGLGNIFGEETFFSPYKRSKTFFENIALSTILNLLDYECYKSAGESTSHLSGESLYNTKHNPLQILQAALRSKQNRRRILVQCDGISTLVDLLDSRYRLLKDAYFIGIQSFDDPESTHYLHDVRVVLCVLYQASFLCLSVQRSMVGEKSLFVILLELLRYLSEACFTPEALSKKNSDTQFDVALDVLLAALRVIINLTHNNEKAAMQFGRLQGIQILFLAFCRIWHLVNHDKNVDKVAKHEMDDKLVYDGCLLLLSAMTNNIENNESNRDTLTAVQNTFLGSESVGALDACSVIVSFFMSKISSYVEYIEATNGEEDSASDINGEASRLLVPEDVILGGCASLLLGCLMKDRPENASMILRYLPDHTFILPLRALSAFVALHSQIGTLTAEVGKSVLEVEKVFKMYTGVNEVRIVNNVASKMCKPKGGDHHARAKPGSSEGSVRSTMKRTLLAAKSQAQFEVESPLSERESGAVIDKCKKNLCGSLSEDSDCDGSHTGPDRCQSQIKSRTCGTKRRSRFTPKTPLRSRKKLLTSIKNRAKRASIGMPLRNLGEDFDACV